MAFASRSCVRQRRQIVSTDFPPGEPREGTGYMVEFAKSAIAHVDPVNGPVTLRGQTLAH